MFKSGTDQQTAYVVPENTSDAQLKSLLWFFRSKVRAGDFKGIGITQPTTKQWGQYGYTSGMLVVYRGAKCASEGYVSDAELDKSKLGPCGYGDHAAAYYQWGLDADPYKDAAATMAKSGDYIPVFDYEDNWHAPSEGLPAVSDATKEGWKAQQQEWEPRQQFAVQVTNGLNQKGIHVQGSANEANPSEFDVQSQLFARPAFQKSFLNEALPQLRSNLCNAGFRTVRVLQVTASTSARTYPLQCR